MATAGNKNNLFQIIGWITIPVVFLVILAGATVRSSGAGMGCPDWPKCFGQYIPPTDVSQLPENYREIYADRGYDVNEFNVVHTWTEYVNRLLGVLAGMFIIALAVASFSYRKKDPLITVLGVFSFLLVSFQGWVGAQVVASNLAQVMISVHLWLALLLVSILIYALMRSYRAQLPFSNKANAPTKLFVFSLVMLVITLFQIFVGTYVRAEAHIAATTLGKANVMEPLFSSLSFLFHRSFVILILVLNIYLVYKLVKLNPGSKFLKITGGSVIGFILLQVVTGIVLSYFSFPAWAQAFHMLFSATLAASQIMLVFAFSLKEKEENSTLIYKAQLATN